MSQQHILQVSELTKKVRFLLENELNTVWLTGEISNFTAASSGHWYLSLKDSKSQVRCAMFKGNNRRVRIKAKNGQQVLVRAKVSLYEPRGDFQLIIEQMEEAGTGLLRQQYEQLKDKLAVEGLFSLAHKQPFPKTINRIGVITSPTGAAIKDILSVLQRRNPNIKIIIYPTLVQGNMAAAQICQAIEQANRRAECDILMVSRGGGSLEDLWCFNEEPVVRAIFASQIPLLSAVGHEIDTTLSDYVADLRAPTPSAGAELVSQDTRELINVLQQWQQRLITSFNHHQQKSHQQLNSIQHRLKQVHPTQKLQLQQQKCDELTLRLSHSVNRKLNQLSQLPQQLAAQLQYLSPAENISNLQQQNNQIQQRLTNAMHLYLSNSSVKFVNIIEKLQLVSPLAVISRGYSIVRNDQAEIISHIKQVNVADKVTIKVCDGVITANVLKIAPQKI